MLLIDYPSKRGNELPDYSKNSTWDLLHTYIDAHSQILIDECQGYGVHAISILKSQYKSITFYDQRRYNRMFQQVVRCTKEGSWKSALLKDFIMIRLWNFYWETVTLKIC